MPQRISGLRSGVGHAPLGRARLSIEAQRCDLLSRNSSFGVVHFAVSPASGEPQTWHGALVFSVVVVPRARSRAGAGPDELISNVGAVEASIA